MTTFHLSNVNVALCASAHNCFAVCDNSVAWHWGHVCLFIHMILFGIDQAVCSLLPLPSFCPPTRLLFSASSHKLKAGQGVLYPFLLVLVCCQLTCFDNPFFKFFFLTSFIYFTLHPFLSPVFSCIFLPYCRSSFIPFLLLHRQFQFTSGS